MTPSVIDSVLVQACRLLGIRGDFTHSHALRKSVVVRLMAKTNRIEGISHRLPFETPNPERGPNLMIPYFEIVYNRTKYPEVLTDR